MFHHFGSRRVGKMKVGGRRGGGGGLLVQCHTLKFKIVQCHDIVSAHTLEPGPLSWILHVPKPFRNFDEAWSFVRAWSPTRLY